MWLLAQLAGLVVIASMLIPDIRQTLFSIGIIAMAFLGIVVLCVVVFALDRAATQEQNLRVMTNPAFVPSIGAPAQKSSEVEPEANGPQGQ
ncbi:MAG: hypothetical protein ABSF60_10075 [Verrucomicrobiota bacterium]|jgi:hypothetical protein